MTCRGRLAINNLKLFEQFAHAHGWVTEPIPAGAHYEALRLRHPEHHKPFILYVTARSEHVSYDYSEERETLVTHYLLDKKRRIAEARAQVLEARHG